MVLVVMLDYILTLKNISELIGMSIQMAVLVEMFGMKEKVIFICPKCGHRNRLYNRQDINFLKYKFKSILNEYKD